MGKPVQLTEEQLQIPEHVKQGGPCCGLAVAGSGKTETIVATVKAIIGAGTRPADILIATFSKVGASDMERRAAIRGVSSMVSWRTLHSCGWSIVGEVSDLPSRLPRNKRRDPVVVDPRGKNGWWIRKMLKEHLKTVAASMSGDRKKAVLKLAGTVLSEISYASSQLIWPDAWTAKDGTEFPEYESWATEREREPADHLTASITADFWRHWEDVKLRPEDHNFDPPKDEDRWLPRPLLSTTQRKERPKRKRVRWFSFDDQIAWPARWILEGKRFMREWKHAFKWVIVDEAQDNNLAQNVLAHHLSTDTTGNGVNMIMVGDDQQCIYTFRGARPDLLGEFYSGAKVNRIHLTYNFRSAQRVLDVGNAILSHAEDRLFDGDLKVGRKDPAAQGGTVTGTQYEDTPDEAAGALDGIQEAIERGIHPSKIAVLYRLNSQVGPVELECIKRGVRYRVAGGKFFDRQEIKTITSFLAVARDDQNEKAWSRVARSIVRGLGPGFFDKGYTTLALAREASRRSLYRTWKKALDELLPHIDKVEHLLRTEDLQTTIEYISEDVGVRNYYRDDSANEEDETDVDVAISGLIECARTLEDVDTLLGFAADDNTGKADKGGKRQSEPAVTLSTIHKAKGLEWEYVAAIGWTAKVFPFIRAPIEEERRLGYVCATRAKQILRVSWTGVDSTGKPAGPSELVFEGSIEEVAESCGEPHWPVGDDPVDSLDPPSDLGSVEWGRKIGS